MRLCSKCGKRKAEPGKYYCKPCRRDYSQDHYRKNRQRYIERNSALRKEKAAKLKALVDEFKSRPCADCEHEFPPYVMDLDHRPGTRKRGNIADLVHQGMEKALLQELKKCEVVCANCHRIRTHDRSQKGS